jgi:hypothetical protein
MSGRWACLAVKSSIINGAMIEVAEAPKGEIELIPPPAAGTGETDKYWLSALIPDQKVQDRRPSSSPTGDGYNWTRNVRNARTDRSCAGRNCEAKTSQLFAGAKEYRSPDKITPRSSAFPYLDYSIDWGWFWFIAIPFFWICSTGFLACSSNFGVAIIGLTIVVRIFMFPIAQKQFASMAGKCVPCSRKCRSAAGKIQRRQTHACSRKS